MTKNPEPSFQCDCTDPGCPTCNGRCTFIATTAIHRADMEGKLLVCDDCADDIVAAVPCFSAPISDPDPDEACATCGETWLDENGFQHAVESVGHVFTRTR